MLDKEYTTGQQEKDENLEECKVDSPSYDDSKPNELDGDVESMGDKSYGSNEEFDYGYAQRVSDDESEEERGILMRMEREVGKILTSLVSETCSNFMCSHGRCTYINGHTGHIPTCIIF